MMIPSQHAEFITIWVPTIGRTAKSSRADDEDGAGVCSEQWVAGTRLWKALLLVGVWTKRALLREAYIYIYIYIYIWCCFYVNGLLRGDGLRRLW